MECRALALLVWPLLLAFAMGLSAHAAVPEQASGTRITVPNLARDGIPGTAFYQVARGDTLYSIAQRYGTTVAALTALNQLADPNVIDAGDYLLVPGQPEPTPGPSTLVTNGSRSTNLVALTFDMGGRVIDALAIMQWLVDNDVKATIFMTGQMAGHATVDEGRQVLDIIDAHPQQFDLGNHSYSHPDMTGLSTEAIQEELVRTEAAIAKTSPRSPRPLFRPPFGAWDSHVLDAVGPAGYAYTVMWDVDTIDWRPEAEGGPTTAQIVSKVANTAQGGSIVLMHLGGYNTLAALPGIISALQAKGLQPALLSEVLAAP